MKLVEREVKSASVVVATVQVPVYDTLEEAVEKEGKDTVLSLFNTQNATNQCNNARASVAAPSKGKIKDTIIQEIMDGKFLEDPEFQAAKGDVVRQRAWVEKLVETRIAEHKAKFSNKSAQVDDGSAEE